MDAGDAVASRRMICARCGRAFDCGLGGECWCAAEPFRLPMPPAAPGVASRTSARSAILEALDAVSLGQAVVPKGWPGRYAARRIAWHALDHAWEIEDRIPTA